MIPQSGTPGLKKLERDKLIATEKLENQSPKQRHLRALVRIRLSVSRRPLETLGKWNLALRRAVLELAFAERIAPFFPKSHGKPRVDDRRVLSGITFTKRILGLGRLRLRGPCGAQNEFTLAATAQNLRKLAKLKPMGPAAS
ncbi:hypothetical protein So717_39930 [Roseobacter cerasinus]|uniref:Transposase DDE domain-containing protein n=1 Tax=Roseobacter cerasinus TaxID=2602289 RepID=A0A640VXY9_9RHOB|nr:hypothetical protein [Roseobacter cerasinus]GFE52240.1 hypothetical protein So717_39930 [Roseobacter cerasinus]